MFKRKKQTEIEAEVPVVEQIDLSSYHTEEEFIEFLQKINSLLKFVTELDYIKDMLLGINKQAEMIENVAASSEEMTASIEDISHFVQDSSAKTNSSIKIANDSILDIENSFKEIILSFEESKRVQLTMDKVSSEAQKINEMVTIIKGVADQTNLLALNASIEAARAGEQGRGFAVVADEIKKLAENTKQQVEHINETVNALTQEINNTSSALIHSNQNFEKGKAQMDTAVGSLDNMQTDLLEINNVFIEISASIEEQTAASQEMSSAIMIVNEESKTLNKEIDKTGRAINSISTIVNDIRMEILSGVGDYDINTQIEVCMCDHLIWRWRVYNMILGYETLTETEVGTHHTCRLGKWCDNTSFESKDMCFTIKEMESPHSDLHVHAKNAIKAYNSGNQELAEKLLVDIDNDSAKVIAELKKMKRIIRKENKAKK